MAAPRLGLWTQQFAAVCLVAVNMRMTISAVGPLLEQISEQEGVRLAALGALGSIPLLTWAVVSPLTHGIGARLGMSRTISWSLAVLTLGTVLRSLPGSTASLWVGTAVIGAALAICNVLMPAIIKRDFEGRVPLVTGVFSAIVGLAGAIASGLVIPVSGVTIAGLELGWRGALLLSGVFGPVALVVWLVVYRRRPGAAPRQLPPAEAPVAGGDAARSRASMGLRVWREPLAWQIAIYMGSQSTLFYTLVTWLVAMEASQGRSAVLAGVDTMLMQLTGIAGAAIPPLFFRTGTERWVPPVLPLLGVVTCAGIILAPSLIVLWAAVGGLGLGATFTMSITLMAIRSRDASGASAVSGMAQSVGYTLAATGPVLFGLLHEAAGGWTVPLLFLTAIALLQTAVGLSVGRPRYLFETPRAPRAPRA